MAVVKVQRGRRATAARASPAECGAIRIHNWMERAQFTGEKTSIKTELAELTAQMGKVSEILL